jgi:hypothetical protein
MKTKKLISLVIAKVNFELNNLYQFISHFLIHVDFLCS